MDRDKIRVIDDPLEVIRARPEMYLGQAWPDPRNLAIRLAEAALLDPRCASIRIAHRGDWWFVMARDYDWLAPVSDDVRSLFKKIIAAPEWGQNSMRPEALIGAFASRIYTRTRGEQPVIVKGEVTSRELYRLATRSPQAARLIAFTLDPTRTRSSR